MYDIGGRTIFKAKTSTTIQVLYQMAETVNATPVIPFDDRKIKENFVRVTQMNSSKSSTMTICDVNLNIFSSSVGMKLFKLFHGQIQQKMN